jgi:pyruvate formate lyase activating enzyme
VLNPETLPNFTEDEVFASVEHRRKWLDGIAITGGEPTLQPGLPEFCKRAKQDDLRVALETNGSNPDTLQDLIKSGLVDYIAMDVKAPLMYERYKELTGVEDRGFFERVLKSMELLLGSPIDYEFRTTLVPSLNLEDIIEIANQIKGAKKYALQQFVPHSTIDPSFEKMRPWLKEAIERTRKAINGMFKSFEVRNI